MAHFRDTPSHGYYYLSAGELASIPPFARRDSYEEDCEWSIAVVACPRVAAQTKVFGPDPDKTLRLAHETCSNWYPDLYEQLTGAICTPENSMKRAEEKFYQDNKDRWITLSASGDWKEGVPPGYVEVYASLGGEYKFSKALRFLVKSEDYKKPASQFNVGHYVIPEGQESVPVDGLPCDVCIIAPATFHGESTNPFHLCAKHAAEHTVNNLLNW